jgi:hypothetical protein
MEVLLLVVVASFLNGAGKKVAHVQHLCSRIVKYTSRTSNLIDIVHFNINKNEKTIKMSIIINNPQVVLLLLYYEYILGRFMH